MQITMEFGTNSLSINVPDGTTAGQLLRNANYQAVLGLSGEERIFVNGSEAEPDYQLEHGDVVRFELRAQRKA